MESFVDVLGGETDETEMMLVVTRREVVEKPRENGCASPIVGFLVGEFGSG